MSARGLPAGLWRRLERARKLQGGRCATHECEGAPERVVRTARYTDLALCVACFDRRKFAEPVRRGSWRDAGARAARTARGGLEAFRAAPDNDAGTLDERMDRDVAEMAAKTGRSPDECFLWIAFYLAQDAAKSARARAEQWLDAGAPQAARECLVQSDRWADLAAQASRAVAAIGT